MHKHYISWTMDIVMTLYILLWSLVSTDKTNGEWISPEDVTFISEMKDGRMKEQLFGEHNALFEVNPLNVELNPIC